MKSSYPEINSSFCSVSIPSVAEPKHVSFRDMLDLPGVYRIFDKRDRTFDKGRMVVFNRDHVVINVIYVSAAGLSPRNDNWQTGWEDNFGYSFVKTDEKMNVSFSI